MKIDIETQKQNEEFDLEFKKRNEVVEVNGIEPMTPCLQSRCSPS